MNLKLKILRQALISLIDNIDKGNTTENEEELDAAIQALTTINKGIPRHSKRWLCDNILHCSESCFNNYLSLGIIPPGHKTLGFKELSWSEKEMEYAIQYRKKHS